MDSVDLELLAACFQARRRQCEMLPLLASALGVLDSEVFYSWVLARSCRQTDVIPNTPWQIRFHGFECDLKNVADGRYLRYDFGPGGRGDCVTAWGVLQFVMTALPPWQEFPRLRAHLARTGPPHDYLSGDHQKVSEAWGRLEHAGCFAAADQGLVDLLIQCTSIGQDGISYVRFPEGTTDQQAIDCLVAHRQVLTARAEQLLGVSASL